MWTTNHDNREQRVALERERVLVDGSRCEDDDQVAGDVDQEIQEKKKAGDADEDFGADR